MVSEGRPDLKLRRALDHLVELRQAVDRYKAANVRVDQRRTNGSIEFVLRVNAAPDLEGWSLVFGDSIHNMRSALDHLAWQLDPHGSRHTQFPVLMKEPSRWPPAAVARMAEPAQVVIRELQPYRWADRGDPEEHFLAILHALDIADKHRVLMLTTTVVSGDSIAGVPFGGSVESVLFPKFADGEPVMRVRVPDGVATDELRCDVLLEVRLVERPNAPLDRLLRDLHSKIRGDVVTPLKPYARAWGEGDAP